MKGKIFKHAAAAFVAAVMTAGYLPEISPIFETAATVWAADMTVNGPITINGDNITQYNNKTITGNVTINQNNAVTIDGVELNLTINNFNVNYKKIIIPHRALSLKTVRPCTLPSRVKTH